MFRHQRWNQGLLGWAQQRLERAIEKRRQGEMPRLHESRDDIDCHHDCENKRQDLAGQ